MNANVGQDHAVWESFWKGMSPDSEIRMWDYYGGRPWVLKYTPRFGEVIEAGCGLGRYVFYLSKLGINIYGLDFSEPVINNLNKWQKEHKVDTTFCAGDVTKLPHGDNTMSGYISLGVIEHFIEGPEKPLNEAYRVLRPGGVAIITTPSYSWYIVYSKLKTRFKRFIKRVLFMKRKPVKFFQYYYRPFRLKKFVERSGLKVTRYASADLLYPFVELDKFQGKTIRKGSFAYWFSNRFENTFLKFLGAQSITISVKVSEIMHCFFCGELNAKKQSLKEFDVPVCDICNKAENVSHYKHKNPPRFCRNYEIDPPILHSSKRTCDYCNQEYFTDVLFEDFGYSKNVCGHCISIPKINIELSNISVKPVWRKRKVDAGL